MKKKEKGQSLVEYGLILILAALAVLIIAFAVGLTNPLNPTHPDLSQIQIQLPEAMSAFERALKSAQGILPGATFETTVLDYSFPKFPKVGSTKVEAPKITFYAS